MLTIGIVLVCNVIMCCTVQHDSLNCLACKLCDWSDCTAAGKEDQAWRCARFVFAREEQIQQAVENIPTVSGPE